MSENREEILANFQALTGIEDVAQAIFVLEENKWDLLAAANKMIPDNDPSSMLSPHIPVTKSTPHPHQQQSSSSSSSSNNHLVTAEHVIDVDMIPDEDDDDVDDEAATQEDMDVMEIPAAAKSAKSMPSLAASNHCAAALPKAARRSSAAVASTSAGGAAATAASGSNMLRFHVQYCDKQVTFELPDTNTLYDLKMVLHGRLGVAPCRQLLSSWARMPQYERRPLHELSLPTDNSLQLMVKTGNDMGVTADEDSKTTERMTGTYNLSINDGTKTFSVQYPGTKTILDVKTGVFSCTDIPVRNQAWTGWPPNIDDKTMLALSGIGFPQHELTVRKKPSPLTSRARRSQQTQQQQLQQSADDEVIQLDSDDEFEDASSEAFNVDDEFFTDNVTSKRVEPLIPDDVEDEIIGSISFSEQFHNRYALNVTFYQGTLDDAIKEACNKLASERKLMAIYLHHDASVLSNVFCSQLLGFESVSQLLSANFVLWGWDVTFESNRAKLQQAVGGCLGPLAATSLKTIPVDRLPAIVIVMKMRSVTDVFTVVYGNVGVNELLSSLLEAVEVFREHIDVEIREERERAERQQVKYEQDLAFQQSLTLDQAKAEAKARAERAATEARLKVEREAREEREKKEAYRRRVEESLPPEPPEDSSGDAAITKIRFKLPEGGPGIERRFGVETPLRVLLDYLIVKGYPSEEFKVISSWPRRDLTAVDCTKSLQELKLYPQETLMLEER